MDLHKLAQTMQDLTGRPLDECLAELIAISEDELAAAMAIGKARAQADRDARNRGENMAVELPPGRRT